MDEISNAVTLRGTPAGRPRFSHVTRGKEFWVFPLEVRRLSGTADVLNVLARKVLLDDLPLDGGSKLSVSGEIRSFRNRTGQGRRLVVAVFARSLVFEDGPDANAVTLRGTLCRRPNLRRTPLGREISDLMLAVPRRYGRSDFLPCIVWGRQAEEAAGLEAGDRVLLTGRMQSRDYVKVLDTGNETRTAYEISAVSLEVIPAPDGRCPGSPPSPEA